MNPTADTHEQNSVKMGYCILMWQTSCIKMISLWFILDVEPIIKNLNIQIVFCV